MTSRATASPKIKHIVDHLLLFGLDDALFVADLHDRPQLILRDGLRPLPSHPREAASTLKRELVDHKMTGVSTVMI